MRKSYTINELRNLNMIKMIICAPLFLAPDFKKGLVECLLPLLI